MADNAANPATPAAPATPVTPATPATPAAPAGSWFDGIANADVKAAASKFKSEGEFLGAIGMEPTAEAPEKYSDFKLPEGMTLDPKVGEKFSELARKHGLTQDAAQEFVTFQSDFMQSLAAQHGQDVAGWDKAARADPDIGGQKYDASVELAKKALQHFGGEKLAKEVLEKYGLGSHPEMIRVFAKIGAAMSEDKIVIGKGGDGPHKSRAERMYPSMNNAV